MIALRQKIIDNTEIVTETGCWIWMLSLNKKGYGVTAYKGKDYRAHRASYMCFVGPITEGKLILHKCDIRCCVNPRHLYEGTDKDNGRDKAQRRRAACKKGILNGRAVLNDHKVKCILALFNSLKSGVSKKYAAKTIANTFGLSMSTVRHIYYKRNWSHVTYP